MGGLTTASTGLIPKNAVSKAATSSLSQWAPPAFVYVRARSRSVIVTTIWNIFAFSDCNHKTPGMLQKDEERRKETHGPAFLPAFPIPSPKRIHIKRSAPARMRMRRSWRPGRLPGDQHVPEGRNIGGTAWKPAAHADYGDGLNGAVALAVEAGACRGTAVVIVRGFAYEGPWR